MDALPEVWCQVSSDNFPGSAEPISEDSSQEQGKGGKGIAVGA